MRIDQLLVQRGHASSRSQAQRLIAAGVAWRLPVPAGNPWRSATKSGDEVPEHADLQLTDTSESRYVSRGGIKLQGALAAAGLSAQGQVCLDVGQSTGGFTDCLLQAGAAHVVGVDVGHAQLHPRIRADERVTCVEKVNARELTFDLLIAETQYKSSDRGVFYSKFKGQFDLVVGDLSFISQTLVLPALVPLLAPQGDLLMLVKPQFELQPQDIGKGGLVRNPASYVQVEQRLRTACADLGLEVNGWFDSPIAGGDGNREFFIHARHASHASHACK